jgi:2-hydroxy-6-oxonona-2,4-dienedioate hydrolase
MTVSEKNSSLSVLLLHGFFGNAHNWKACAEALSARWQVLVPQLPFFGLSHRRDRMEHLMEYLNNLLEARRVKQFVAVGNSLGGQLAVNLALRQPGRIAGLVLTGSSGLYERNLTSKVQRRPQREWVRSRVRDIFYDETHVTDSQVDEVMALLYDRQKAFDILLLAKSIRNESLRDVLPQVRCPVRLIWGEDDQITPPDTAREFKALLPNSELHFLAKCGHAPMMEHPRQFNKLVEDFVERMAKADAQR